VSLDNLLQSFGLTTSEFYGLILLLIFAGAMIYFRLRARQKPWNNLRPIRAFQRFTRAVGLAVEDGSRLHVSIGRGNITDTRSAAAFIGISIVSQITRVASASDKPPIATTGDAAIALLTRDTLRDTYQSMEASEQFDPDAAQLTGLTPFSYVAGTIPLLKDENVSASVLAGNFGSEAALLMDASDRLQGFTLAGTDNVPGQAILYATAQEPLIGEELYAGGAYLDAGPMHTASLRAQDVIRWTLIGVIILGGLAKFVGGLF